MLYNQNDLFKPAFHLKRIPIFCAVVTLYWIGVFLLIGFPEWLGISFWAKLQLLPIGAHLYWCFLSSEYFENLVDGLVGPVRSHFWAANNANSQTQSTNIRAEVEAQMEKLRKDFFEDMKRQNCGITNANLQTKSDEVRAEMEAQMDKLRKEFQAQIAELMQDVIKTNMQVETQLIGMHAEMEAQNGKLEKQLKGFQTQIEELKGQNREIIALLNAQQQQIPPEYVFVENEKAAEKQQDE